MDVPLARLRQKHVSDDGDADGAPMGVSKFDAPDTDRGPNAHQVRPRHEAAFGDRAKVVDLQFDGGEFARSIEVTVERGTDGRVGDARRDASMQRALAVEQLGPDAAVDGDAVAVEAHEFESQQMVEGVPGEKFLNEFLATFGVAQVW